MIITKELELKIRNLCSRFSNTEWSGVLFYSIKNKFGNKDFKVIAKDLLLMDIGDGASTEFEENPDVIAYMVEHNLLESNLYTGLIHSHHSMATFFSGTDTNTLRKEGNDTIHFVSLIVNNAGSYTAAITNKATNLINSSIKTTVKSFNNEDFVFDNTEEKTNDVIQYSMLDIEIEKNNELDELNNRINEIKVNKTNNAKIQNYKLGSFVPNRYPNINHFDNQKSLWEDDEWSYQNSRKMIENYSESKLEDKKSSDFILEDNNFSNLETMSDSMIKKLITCNILVTDKSKIELDKWIKNIDTLYPKTFRDIKEFEYWAEAYIDCILHYMFPINIEEEDEEIRGYNISIICENVIKRLEKLVKNNKYIDAYIDVLTTYTL